MQRDKDGNPCRPSANFFIYTGVCNGKHMKCENLAGKTFGRLTVIDRSESTKDGRTKWLCECSCGNICAVIGRDLKNGHTRSCGCYRKEFPNHKTHGLIGTRVYNAWRGMRERCYNQKNRSYKDYGNRGIQVCEEWRNDAKSFAEYVSKLPHCEEKGYTLHRIDNDGDYEPNNVMWADRETQANNKQCNHLLVFNGETHTISEWSVILGIKYSTLSARINVYHWSVEKALTTPVRIEKINQST